MSNGLLIENTKNWVIVKIPRQLLKVKGRAILTAEKALKIFKKGKEEYRAGKLTPVSSLKEIL